jgi:hypothetical protein
LFWFNSPGVQTRAGRTFLLGAGQAHVLLTVMRRVADDFVPLLPVK